MLQDCPIPEPTGRDNAALAEYSSALRLRLLECNLDKEALRNWDAQARN